MAERATKARRRPGRMAGGPAVSDSPAASAGEAAPSAGDDPVDTASYDSFPASDSPGWIRQRLGGRSR